MARCSRLLLRTSLIALLLLVAGARKLAHCACNVGKRRSLTVRFVFASMGDNSELALSKVDVVVQDVPKLDGTIGLLGLLFPP